MKIIKFGCMVNDKVRLDMVLRQSRIKDIEVYTITDADSAAKGLNKLLDIIQGEGADIGVLTHQDMYYREGWIEQMQSQISLLPDSWIIAGIIGKNMDGELIGIIHDMRRPQYVGSLEKLPLECCCIDECCIIVNMKSGFRFDGEMEGFDLYGTYACLKAKEMGTAWIIDCPAEHYCMRSWDWFPDENFSKTWGWLYRRFPGVKIDSTVLAAK